MSTNFYLRDVNSIREHIGKRNAGWIFDFNGQNFNTVKAWRGRLDNLGSKEFIIDERGQEYSASEFWCMVYATRSLTRDGALPKNSFEEFNLRNRHEDDGFAFSNYEFS